MRSHLAALVPGLVALAAALLLPGPEPALAGDDASEWSRGSMTLRLYGACAPVQIERGGVEESQGGYGAGFTFAAGPRWDLSVDASHFESIGRGVTPILVGASYGADHGRAFRPRVGVGLGYYGITRPSYAYATASFFGPEDRNHGSAGGYLGLGADWALSRRAGLSFDLRSHLWREREMSASGWDGLESRGSFHVWDGFVGVSAGLTILLSKDTRDGAWASR